MTDRTNIKKAGVFNLVLIITPLLAGLYGVLHDQITYSISHEYYTRFKFRQFGFFNGEGEAILDNPRMTAAKVGFLATWWTGIIIGLAQALTGLIHRNSIAMQKFVTRAIVLNILVALAIGLIGLAFGKFYLARLDVSWNLPQQLIDKENFIAVGSMHNFSYLGGLLGLIAGIVYQFKQKNKMQKAGS